jgi:hypothetical protein|tara:strand:- start:218 stop:409 length:192 start_codon:yes stop_codon:yes gene_type:complete
VSVASGKTGKNADASISFGLSNVSYSSGPIKIIDFGFSYSQIITARGDQAEVSARLFERWMVS